MFKLRTIAITGVLAAVIFATSATLPENEQPVRYKNLKVLPKDISEEELEKVMRHYNKALGVKCNFCHAKATDGSNKMNFASDEKPEKAEARSMMKMTRKINQKYFGQKKDVYNHATMEISCYSCHHGKTKPEN